MNRHETMGRLDQARGRIRGLREDLTNAQRRFDHARETGDQTARDEAFAAVEALGRQMGEARELETRILGSLAGVVDAPGLGLANDLQAQDRLREIAQSSAPLSNYIRVGEFSSIDELCATFGQVTGARYATTTMPDVATLPGTFSGIAAHPEPAQDLLGVWGIQPMTERVVSYLQRGASPSGGDGISAAEVVAPGAIKPSLDASYEPSQAEAAVVAVWTKALRADLADFGGLREDIGQLLANEVRTRLEANLLAAIGAASGVLTTPNVTAAANIVDAVVLTVAELRARGVRPTFVALHPSDVAAFMIAKESTAGGYLFPSSPFGQGGLPPLVQSVALGAGEVLLGDASLAGYIGVREGLSIAVGEESEDYTRNMCTLLCETRAVPVIKVPTALAHFTYPGA